MSINQPEIRPEQTAPTADKKELSEEERDKAKAEAREFIQQENKSPDDFE